MKDPLLGFHSVLSGLQLPACLALSLACNYHDKEVLCGVVSGLLKGHLTTWVEDDSHQFCHLKEEIQQFKHHPTGEGFIHNIYVNADHLAYTLTKVTHKLKLLYSVYHLKSFIISHGTVEKIKGCSENQGK